MCFGTGYAVLDLMDNDEENAFQPLIHIIEWCETEEEEFQATWCRFCHPEGHTNIDTKNPELVSSVLPVTNWDIASLNALVLVRMPSKRPERTTLPLPTVFSSYQLILDATTLT
ncbi:hypothetical protein BDB01DRAFT_659 [Pilobolus umbonatus]|nr:hypothetical protein BDB01DRAFT_659 [Pilobolus umbonatus]